MKLSISNIGWTQENDNIVYNWMKKYGYTGLEIAPTRIFPQTPYSRLEDAKKWLENMKSEYDFLVVSMQSIWYGRTEKIFGTPQERRILVDYTKKAVDFAEVIGCRNLVFGCPGNRIIPEDGETSVAIGFFKEIGDYAAKHKTVIAMEPISTIYNTNYINTIESALQLIKDVDSPGLLLNLDTGTMIQNGETVEQLSGKVNLINHVHISEPDLKPVKDRNLHRQLYDLLFTENYDGFISVEMGKTNEVDIIKETMQYVNEIFQ